MIHGHLFRCSCHFLAQCFCASGYCSCSKRRKTCSGSAGTCSLGCPALASAALDAVTGSSGGVGQPMFVLLPSHQRPIPSRGHNFTGIECVGSGDVFSYVVIMVSGKSRGKSCQYVLSWSVCTHGVYAHTCTQARLEKCVPL